MKEPPSNQELAPHHHQHDGEYTVRDIHNNLKHILNQAYTRLASVYIDVLPQVGYDSLDSLQQQTYLFGRKKWPKRQKSRASVHQTTPLKR